MGGVCCKEASVEEVLTSENLSHNLVREQRRSFDQSYEIVEVIGEGSISKISKIKRKEIKVESLGRTLRKTLSSTIFYPDVYYALKEIDTSMVSDVSVMEFHNEIELLKSLDHPNIIKVYETYSLRNRTAIVMEICSGGDLYSRRPYSEKQTSNIVEQILGAVVYLHDRNIVHRDLKHENVMFATANEADYTIKVIDFGLAKKYLYRQDRHHERVGTLYTMSPEVMFADYAGSQSDMWSIGVMTYVLLSGEKPFVGKTAKETIALVRHGDLKFKGDAWKHISDDAKSFVTNLLQKDPDKRMVARAASEHPFIKNTNQSAIPAPDPELIQKVKSNFVRYADSSDFKKIALMVIAKKSTSEEIFELRNVFSEFDTGHDGTISFDEFKQALLQTEYSEEEVESIFNSIDVNHAGKILYTDFLAAALEAKGNIAKHKIAEAFAELDEDSDGYITKENLRKILPKTTTDDEIERLIADVDNDEKDGRISFDEFKRAFTDEHHNKVSRLYDGQSQHITHSSHVLGFAK